MTRDLGALVVGAGDMGGRHARAWTRAGVAVRAIVDVDPARAAGLAAAHDADASVDLSAALARPDVDVVSVCTPTSLHADVTVAALARDLHVLCEKPVALTLDDAARMRRAAAASRGEVRFGFMRRFDPAQVALEAAVARIGRPLLAQATLTAGIRPKLLMHDALGNGGPIIDMCCHLFDQWATLFGGPPERVRARAYTFGELKSELAPVEHHAIDTASLLLDYPDGGEGHVQVSWGLPAGVPHDERHSYVGPDGLVACDWPDVVSLHASAEPETWTSPGIDAWDAEIAHAADWLRGGPADPLATLEDGIAALEASLAALTAAAERRAVPIGDAPDPSADAAHGAAGSAGREAPAHDRPDPDRPDPDRPNPGMAADDGEPADRSDEAPR